MNERESIIHRRQFKQCVMFCLNNEGFVDQFNTLHNAQFNDDVAAILEQSIDKALGTSLWDDRITFEMRQFMAYVFEQIYWPIVSGTNPPAPPVSAAEATRQR